MNVNKKVIERCWKVILEKGLSLDLKDPNLADTPKRIAEFYKKFFGTKDIRFKEFPSEQYNGIVVIKSHGFSFCAHHFLPFEFICFVGYIPNKKVIGASKIPRIIDMFAKQPQIQERMTEQIADFVYRKFKVDGVIVVVKGEHLCMKMRGIEKINSKMITSSIRGCFENSVVRKEFFDLLKIKDE